MEVNHPYDIAYLTASRLEEHHEIIRTNVWIETCRRFHNNSRLFGIVNTITGRTALAAWVYSPDEAAQPLLLEIEGFDGDPNSEWPFAMPPEIMRSRLKPIEDDTQRPFRDALRKHKALEAMARQLDHAEKKDIAQYHLRHGRADVAAAIMRRPFVGAGSADDEHRREMSKMLYDQVKRLP